MQSRWIQTKTSLSIELTFLLYDEGRFETSWITDCFLLFVKDINLLP